MSEILNREYRDVNEMDFYRPSVSNVNRPVHVSPLQVRTASGLLSVGKVLMPLPTFFSASRNS